MVRLTPSSLGTAATAVAYDETHTRLAVADQAGRVTVWERGWESAGWELASTFPLPQGVSSSRSQPLHLCWAPPEFGSVLCSSGADGTVCVWGQQPAQAPPPATAEATELGAGSQPNGTAHGDGQASGVEAGGVWQLCARLQASSLSVQALAFAPGQPRPLLAAACADGYVRLYGGGAALAAEQWRLESELAACPSGAACTALFWREHTHGLPPMLAVGTATEGALLFVYEAATRRWRRAAVLVGSGSNPASGGQVRAVGWAPTLGRQVELVAVAAGQAVTVWSLEGPADSLKADVVASLPHPSPVAQLEWNLTGNWLAASTGNKVFMWRPDLAGEWRLLNTITGGGAGAAAGARGPSFGPQAMAIEAA